MAHDIVMIRQMGDALRNTGYKSIESAVSEIIDNSIEANANDILVLVKESVDPITGRKNVSEFAFLDNGTGMDLDKLGSCLGIGFTTRSKRKSMGRFGVGLPQASLHVCPSVDVYSWQEGIDNCHKVFLNIDSVREGLQTQIDDPTKTPVPSEYEKFITYKTPNKQYDFTKSGTFVHWKNCDRVNPKTVRFLFQTLDFSLGQKFRYLIKDGTHNIRLVCIGNEEFSQDIMPNDPLFLFENNYVLGNPEDPGNISPRKNINCTEPLFEPYGNDEYPNGIVPVPVKYYDRKTHEVKTTNVEIKFSKIRDIFYDQTAIAKEPGGTPMGKHALKMEGISIVRAGREVDFGMFDFYTNLVKPQHRWWGCEINFTPELDEAFGVANNKQHVELKALSKEDYEAEEVLPMWLQLYSIVNGTIDKIFKENQKTRHKSRTVEDIQTPTTQIVNSAEETSETEGETDRIRNQVPEDELIEKTRANLLEQGVENVTEEEVRSYMKNKVNIVHKDLKRGPFFDFEFSLGSCNIELNTSHIFYQKFLSSIEANPDMQTAFELFIAAFVKTIDELVGDEQRKISDVIVQDWNTKLTKYINEQYSYGK